MTARVQGNRTSLALDPRLRGNDDLTLNVSALGIRFAGTTAKPARLDDAARSGPATAVGGSGGDRRAGGGAARRGGDRVVDRGGRGADRGRHACRNNPAAVAPARREHAGGI